MSVLLWTLVAIVASPFVVRMAFMGLCTAKRLHASGIDLSVVDETVILILFAVGWPADVIYNWTVGWYRFGEIRDITYSSRIQWYVRHPDRVPEGTQEIVNYWFEYLNVADPGHIKPKA
jgi:hypothetical protein